MSDLGTCPLPELIEQLKKTGKKALDDNDFIRGMVFNMLAQRFENCEILLTSWIDDDEITDDLQAATEKQLGR